MSRRETGIRTSAVFLAGAFAASGLWPLAAQQAGSRQTREFVQAAAQSDTFEELEAQTVLGQSADPQIRAFAQQMIEAHMQTTAALAAATMRAGLEPPSKAMSSDQAQWLGALQSVRGPEFDRLYVRQQVLAHRSALITEQRYASGGDQLDVKLAAASATPIIASHLQMAEQMQAKFGG
uniref:DUF4142 domain-containing protein n=1 Tax=uncultured Sphingomonas sp. TaxID=158754 RepID=UPI0035CB672C